MPSVPLCVFQVPIKDPKPFLAVPLAPSGLIQGENEPEGKPWAMLFRPQIGNVQTQGQLALGRVLRTR